MDYEEMEDARGIGRVPRKLKGAEHSKTTALSLEEYLKQKQEREKQREAGELLGYGLTKFKGIEENIDGIQPGFYIIGADTNLGKTAFLTNIFLDLLDTNSETKGLYFSLDDNKDIIITRFMGIRTGLRLNQIQRKQENEADQKKVDEAYQYLRDLAKERRLFVKDLDEVSNIRGLEKEIKEQARDKIIIAIDGLYNLDIGKKYSSIREANIERADRVKKLVDIYKVPILCTGELRKTGQRSGTKKDPTIDDLMETSKLGYNANLVWLLYPARSNGEDMEDEFVLKISFAKNKLSHFRGYQELIFERAVGIIKEE